MITPELLEYIKREKKQNTSKEVIRDKLLKNGWALSDIEEAYRALNFDQQMPQSIPTDSAKNIWNKVLAVFLIFFTFNTITSFTAGILDIDSCFNISGFNLFLIKNLDTSTSTYSLVSSIVYFSFIPILFILLLLTYRILRKKSGSGENIATILLGSFAIPIIAGPLGLVLIVLFLADLNKDLPALVFYSLLIAFQILIYWVAVRVYKTKSQTTILGSEPIQESNLDKGVINNNYKYSPKSRTLTLLLCLFFGQFGFHQFYVGRTSAGLIRLFTFGGFGILYLIDLIQILTGNFKDKSGLLVTKWFN